MEGRLELSIEVSSDEEEDGMVTLGELNSAEDDDLDELLISTEASGDGSSSEESDVEGE